MMRRFLCCVVIAGCTGVAALIAAERATFILNDGERMSGTVLSQRDYSDRGRENFSRGAIALLTDDGRRIPIRLDQVAVIQFGGGRADRAELDALSTDRRQMIVWRDGSIEPGRVIDLTSDGEVVRWQGRNGREQVIPFRDLSRIYLNADTARTALNYADRDNPGFRGRDERGFRNGDDSRFGNRNDGFGNRNEPGFRNGDRTVGTSGTGSADVRVNANQQWTNTGINVRAGDLISFNASGRINFGQGATQTAGPEGNDSLKRATYPAAGMPVGELIGRVGNGPVFPIGSGTQPIRMGANGPLMLGVNDDEIGDNSGFFSVVITRQ
jgi:hypothetical protein